MSTSIRYPFLGCLALFLAACSSSGSQTLIGSSPESIGELSTELTDVEYLLVDGQAISGARDKFTSSPPADDDATEPVEDATALATARTNIVNRGNRYLSTGALLMETAGGSTVAHTMVDAACQDGAPATYANCNFDADSLRDEVTLHLGPTNTHDSLNDVGFRSFSVNRQAVMDYRGVRLSQVRVTGTDEKEVPGAPDAPATSNYHYVGYDGVLEHSMFFVGVYRFFDEDGGLEHQRIENASLGQIYDADAATSSTDIDNPGVSLEGTGAMVGMESEAGTLNSHLVQGDVMIDYRSANIGAVDITIGNIQRLVGDDDAWYAQASANPLVWTSVQVRESRFTGPGLAGSFYGTGTGDAAKYEVGGVFRHTGLDLDATNPNSPTYSIIGSFGSALEPR